METADLPTPNDSPVDHWHVMLPERWNKALWPMKLRSISPITVLRNYVRSFQQREAQLDATTLIYPITARPDQFLEFYLEQRYVIVPRESRQRELAPRAVVVGPCTHRSADLVLNGRWGNRGA